jgi:peptidoglycan/xylan/chitin deacetylase (PgdA/CDA1 family)
MSLSPPTMDGPERGPWDAPLAPVPTARARARSRVIRSIASRALPSSVLFARGARRWGRKRIGLTFDDGPDAMTERYLDLLTRFGVRATFFVIGENAARAPDLVREYVRRGHEVGGHGWSHESFSTMSGERLGRELTRTQALLPSNGRRRLVRPPRGELSLGALLRTAAGGYTSVLWSVDSNDCRSRDPRAIEESVTPDAAAPGDVVLMHELQPWTLDALPRVIDRFHGDGWEFATVSELMGQP